MKKLNRIRILLIVLLVAPWLTAALFFFALAKDYVTLSIVMGCLTVAFGWSGLATIKWYDKVRDQLKGGY